MKLSKRLLTIGKMCEPAICAADIGTDHAYIPIWLVQNGIAQRAIASDINQGPLDRARHSIAENGLQDSIDLRLGDGFAAVRPGEADEAIISGIGGDLMIRLLEGGADVTALMHTLVLSPHSEHARVRRFLMDSGMRIADETMVLDDGKYYTVIKAHPGRKETQAWSEAELLYGRYTLRSGDVTVHDFLLKEIDKFTKIKNNIDPENGRGTPREYYAACGGLKLCSEALDIFLAEAPETKKTEAIYGMR